MPLNLAFRHLPIFNPAREKAIKILRAKGAPNLLA